MSPDAASSAPSRPFRGQSPRWALGITRDAYDELIKIRVLAPLGEGQVVDALRYQNMIGYEGWVPMGLCR